MKILFICAGLEAGKDGVGDYTRKLACSIKKQGIETTIIALNDKQLKTDSLEETQTDEGEMIPVVRFSNNNSDWNQKTAQARQLVQMFSPGWISIQYVPYGFNKKGLPFRLAGYLKTITAGYKCHIMFHEMWIGLSPSASISHKCYGYLQRKIALQLVKKIKPQINTTTNLLYQQVMQQSHINVSVLPLMSNIEKQEKDNTFLSDIAQRHSISFNDGRFFIIGIFGTLYFDAQIPVAVPQFIKERKSSKPVVVIAFGKNNNPSALQVLENNLGDTAKFVRIGELGSWQVSSLLQVLDIAVLCTPKEFIGKSGAYAALRLHNVPVVAPSGTPIPKYQQSIENYNKLLAAKRAEEWSVAFVSGSFLNMLNT